MSNHKPRRTTRHFQGTMVPTPIVSTKQLEFPFLEQTDNLTERIRIRYEAELEIRNQENRVPKDDKKSPIDRFFDMADDVLDKVDRALPDKPTRALPAKAKPPAEDVSVDPTDAKALERWEKTWEEVRWAFVPSRPGDNLPDSWHAFREGVTSVCGTSFPSHTIERQVIEHGKSITACTSCIIGISK